LLRRVIWQTFTDVSELLAASIISAMTEALMMEAASTTEKPVNFYQTTRCNNPEDSHLHTHRRENTKSHSSCTPLTVPHLQSTITQQSRQMTL
jgi:hypothetical protein